MNEAEEVRRRLVLQAVEDVVNNVNIGGQVQNSGRLYVLVGKVVDTAEKLTQLAVEQALTEERANVEKNTSNEPTCDCYCDGCRDCTL